jgi:hypothetical protein
MMRSRLAVIATLLFATTSGAQIASYRVRLDARTQAVSFRGLVADSIAAALVVPSADGGVETPDGHAVHCGSSNYCFYFRPGDILRGVPVTTSASVTLWGFGVEGLSFRGAGRWIGDLGPQRVWPGTEPALQLLEGFFEYQRSATIARAGRQYVSSRLEPVSFDGAWARHRWRDGAVDLAAYGGWGIGQATSVPITSPALNPLDEWRPRDRQLVGGLEAGWLYRGADLRGEYRREVDPAVDYFVSERAALSLAAGVARLRASGGVEYNLAEGHFGTSDILLTYPRPRYSVSLGARRYVPYFSLWTLWGAFSPVPYSAVNASTTVRATDQVSVHARGERYQYDEANVSTGLVPKLTDAGWRGSAGIAATLDAQWSADVTYGLEHGPGASGRFIDGSITFAPGERYVVSLNGGSMARPLELRFYDATSRWIGGRGELQVGSQRRLWTDLALVQDERQRPDPGGSSLSQLRLRAGVSVVFGSSADRLALPPAHVSGR